MILKNIVWLVSYPKSGNTWFRIFLENVFAPAGESKGINQLEKSIIASSRYLVDYIAGASSTDLNENEIEELRPKVYRRLAEQATEVLFLKVHDAWRITSSGASLFPKEVTRGVIYLIRNPLDIAVSYSNHASKELDTIIEDMNNPNFTLCNNPRKIDHQVKQILTDWSSHVESWIDNSKLPVHIVRYEDMLYDSLNTFQTAMDSIGIKIENDKLRSAIAASDFKVLKEMELLEGFNEKPMHLDSFFHHGKDGSWKQILNESQINAIFEKHQKQMIKFDYLPDKTAFNL